MQATSSTRHFSRAPPDLRDRWRLAGYDIASLLENMKALFAEVESDAHDRAANAREALIEEILDFARQ